MLSTTFLALSLVGTVFADHHGHVAPRHHAIAQRAHLQKRAEGPLTFFDVGLGACGHVNQPSDFIVALNSEEFGSGYPGPHCHQTIVIQYGGKTARATIMDECPGCKAHGPHGLDLSTGLFNYFASPDLGVLQATWWYDGGFDPAGNGPPQNQGSGGDQQSTSTHHTSTHWTWKSTSTTHSATTSKTTTTTTTSKTSTSTSTSSTPTPSVSAPSVNDGETIESVYKAFVYMDSMIAFFAGTN